MKPKMIFSLITFIALICVLPLSGEQAKVSGPGTDHKYSIPEKGHINVAFILTDGAVVIDFAGPWEVFQDVHIPSRGATMEDQMIFHLYTVSASKNPVTVSDGMRILPDYTFEDAPKPQIVVVPAQSGGLPEMMDYIRKMSTQSEVLMSVCNGAFQLGKAGVLNGKKATAHHGSYQAFLHEFPDVMLQKGMRYVQSDSVIFTAGGLSSGIDLALHIVELYFGRGVAQTTANQMEYEGKGWLGDGSATVKFTKAASTIDHPSDGLSGGVLGNWKGTVQTNDGTFEVALHVWNDPAGLLTGSLDSLDEDVTSIPITSISNQGVDLHFEVESLNGIYDGKVNSDGSAIAGAWKQRGGSFPLVLKRIAK